MAKLKPQPVTSRFNFDKELLMKIGGAISVVGIVGYLSWILIIYPYFDKRVRGEGTRRKIEIGFKEYLVPFAEQTKGFPTVEEGRKFLKSDIKDKGFDGWGQRLKYQDRKRFVELRSSGADKKFGTKDDIFMTSEDFPASFGPHQDLEANKAAAKERAAKKASGME